MVRVCGGISRLFGSAVLLVICTGMGLAQTSPSQPNSQKPALSSHSVSTFVIREADLQNPPMVIAYGDMRFTDPSALPAENVAARRALAARVAEERPDAVLLNGDLTMHGGDHADYAVYQNETQAWRDAGLRIFPVPGNHEFSNCEISQCLQNWWGTFPELKNHRWYSVQLGTNLFLMSLDSNTSLLPGSPQYQWVAAQISSLPKSFKFVFINMHHEPVGDVQVGADDNPRPNEMALADLLRPVNRKSQARFIVIAGHIHNYERFEQDGVTYLVSGGGGAPQQRVDRNPADLYQDNSFPNFHYVKFVLQGDNLNVSMERLADASGPVWESKDTFKIEAKTKPVTEVHNH